MDCPKCNGSDRENQVKLKGGNVTNAYRFKKTTVGYGLLLIDMGKDSSISLLATGETKQQQNFGTRNELYCQ